MNLTQPKETGLSQPEFPTVPWSLRDTWLGLAFLPLWFVLAAVVIGFSDLLPVAVDAGVLINLGEALLLIPVWWFATRKHGAGREALGLRPYKRSILNLGFALLALFYLFNFAYSLALASFNLEREVDIVALLSELSSPWLLFLGGVVVAPLVEEVYFRGFVFAGLRERYGWLHAASISSAMFALLHFQLWNLLPIFLLGFLFAYLYQRSGSIWPGILLHAAVNGLSLGIAYLVIELGSGA
jgi:membrane protease YdiL (CAAX protease family)